MYYKDKTILVTGGAGFIGSHLCDELLKHNPKKIICFDNFVASKHENIIQNLKNPKFELVVGDIRDYDVIAPFVHKSEVVFHLAAAKLVMSMKRPRIDLETNVMGMFNILQAAKENKPRIVYSSTGSVLGSSEKPMREDNEKNPTTIYGINKLTSEHYCNFYKREFDVPVTVIRYFHVYGPRQDYSGEAGVVSIFISRVLNGLPPLINGTGEQIRCFTYVADDVKATMMLAENHNAVGEIYNVASHTRISVKELAELVCEKYGKGKIKPEYIEPRIGENLKPIPDTSKIESIGFKAEIDFSTGLDYTKKWISETENI